MKKLLLIVDPQIDFIQQIGILIIIVRLLMRVEYGHAIVYNTLLVQLFGSRYWLLLMNQRAASPYCIRVIA